MKAYRRREVLKLLGTTVIYEVTFGLSGCLGNKGESYESSDIESKKAELEETIKRETAQKTKNIWTDNPDYVGRKLSDFVIPDELKNGRSAYAKMCSISEVREGEAFDGVVKLQGRVIEVSMKCIEKENVSRVPDNYILEKVRYEGINELGLSSYGEEYESDIGQDINGKVIFTNPKIRIINYENRDTAAGPIFDVMLGDKDRNGIIDYVSIRTKDAEFEDLDGSGNLNRKKSSLEELMERKPSKQTENAIGNEISSQLGIP